LPRMRAEERREGIKEKNTLKGKNFPKGGRTVREPRGQKAKKKRKTTHRKGKKRPHKNNRGCRRRPTSGPGKKKMIVGKRRLLSSVINLKNKGGYKGAR